MIYLCSYFCMSRGLIKVDDKLTLCQWYSRGHVALSRCTSKLISESLRPVSYVLPCRALPCRAVPCGAVPCCVVSCRVVSCRVVPCRAAPRLLTLANAGSSRHDIRSRPYGSAIFRHRFSHSGFNCLWGLMGQLSEISHPPCCYFPANKCCTVCCWYSEVQRKNPKPTRMLDQGRRNRGARGAMAPSHFGKLCKSAPSKSKNSPSKSII